MSVYLKIIFLKNHLFKKKMDLKSRTEVSSCFIISNVEFLEEESLMKKILYKKCCFYSIFLFCLFLKIIYFHMSKYKYTF